MSDRGFAAVAAAAIVLMIPLAAAGQASPQGWNVPRTADGQPDLQGIWDFRTITPMERPSELAGKEILTREEAAQYEQETLEARDKDLRASDGISTNRDVANAYNQFWWDYGDRLTEDRRTSLIVDPQDGRIPWTRTALQARQERAAARAATPGGRITPGPEDRGLAERCILGFNSGPPMVPSAYNNNFQRLQAPSMVVIVNEMVHNARIVPMDDRAHLAKDVRQWVGDSRGPLGGRHLGRGNNQLPPRHELWRIEREPAPHRTLQAGRRRHAPLRVHGRRSEDMDGALDGGDSNVEDRESDV